MNELLKKYNFEDIEELDNFLETLQTILHNHDIDDWNLLEAKLERLDKLEEENETFNWEDLRK